MRTTTATEECRRLGAPAENTDLISTVFEAERAGAGVIEPGRKMAGDAVKAEAAERAKNSVPKMSGAKG